MAQPVSSLAVFQVLRRHGIHLTQYGVNHSIHCAIAAYLTAHRLGWQPASTQPSHAVVEALSATAAKLSVAPEALRAMVCG